MNTVQANNKRIARNTILLYIRMFFVMGISLYTSRVLLNTLGIIDYGIYNVVAGVITLLSFITTSMSSSSSRFLTFALGTKNETQLKKTFGAACTIHLLIAIIIAIIAETLGVWFLETQLVIPEERMTAARIVYHFSVASTIITIIQVPFMASLLSHEKIDIYAIIEIINISLKLLIVILLVMITFDKLIVYSILFFLLTLTIFLIYRFYCYKKFSECKFRIVFNKEISFPMLSFSGWDLYGNMSTVARTQGVNILLNLFFGPILNTASGIAAQVQNAINSFSANVLIAVRPQIVKSYANNDKEYMIRLINNSAKFSYLLLVLITIPLIIEMPFILKVWLIQYPEYTISFCRLTLGFNLIANISSVIMIGIHATGKIKRSSLWNGSLYLLVIPISYFVFRQGGSPVVPFILNIVSVGLGCSLNIWYLRNYIPEFSCKQFIKSSLMPVVLISSFTFFLSMACYYTLSEGWYRLLCIVFCAFLSISILSFYFVFERDTQQWLLHKVYTKFSKR